MPPWRGPVASCSPTPWWDHEVHRGRCYDVRISTQAHGLARRPEWLFSICAVNAQGNHSPRSAFWNVACRPPAHCTDLAQGVPFYIFIRQKGQSTGQPEVSCQDMCSHHVLRFWIQFIIEILHKEVSVVGCKTSWIGFQWAGLGCNGWNAFWVLS